MEINANATMGTMMMGMMGIINLYAKNVNFLVKLV